MMQADGQARWGRIIRWGAGLAVAGLSCWLLARDLDWQSLGQAIGSADYRWVIVGALAILGTFFTRARRWQVLLWQSNVSLQPAMTALLVGQAANMVLPMRSGDVVRATWVGPAGGTGIVEALGSIAVEKVWDLVALLACCLLLLALIPLPGWFAQSTWGTALMLIVGGGLLLAALRWRAPLFRWAGRFLAYLPAGWDQALVPRLRRLANGLEVIRQPHISAQALFWTGLTWGLGAVANWAVLMAFGVPSVVVAVFLLAALMVGSAVPTPGKLGIFEGICVLSLDTLFHLAPYDRALAAGLVLHLVVIGPPLVVAAILAFWPRCHSRSAGEPA